MRPSLKPILVVLAALAAALPAAAPAVPDLKPNRVDDPGASYVPGEVIVRYEPGTVAAERHAVRSAADVDFERSLRVPRAQLVDVDGSVQAAVARLERQPDVAFAQPNYRYHVSAVSPPDDTFFGDLWGLESPAVPNPGVDALEGWESNRGAGQVIAVADTGVALDHPDLQGNLWTGPGGIHGHDFVDGDDDPDDYNFHGTHVAGTAAAIDDNALGIAGVAPDAQIMAVRVLDGDGSGSSADIGSGIAFAAQNGADVINLSLGGDADSDPLMSAGIAIADEADAVVVAAAGNDSNDNDDDGRVPCVLPHPNVICVAAVTEAGALAGFSNFGATTVDVGAPGTSILSAETDYASIFSESFAGGIGAWTTSTVNGGLPWSSVASPNSDGNSSASDSSGGNYANSTSSSEFAESRLVKTTGLDLTGERGCRMHFDARYALESNFDFLEAGAVTPAGLPSLVAQLFTGSTGTSFFAEEVSISDHDGEPSVSPWFTVLSDDSVVFDGAYVDDLNVLCRDSTYSNAAPPAGNYVEFQGTSMATPHVAGVAALVRAADPGAPDSQVVQAIMDGGSPLASLSGTTVSGRTADADGAIAAALGTPNPPPAQQTPQTPSQQTPTYPPPAKPNLSGAKSTLRVSKRRTFSYSFRATPGLNGNARFRTAKKVTVSRKAHLTLARKPFTVLGSGRVTVTVKLSKKQLRILRDNGKFVLNVTATVRNVLGLTSQATKKLTLKPPKR